MSAFTPLPLGQRIPDRPHAVSCSLPTMRAVRGYEEKDPAITQHLTSGYPRFVVHPFLRQLAQHLATELHLAGETLWLASSPAMARGLAAYLGERARVIAAGQLAAVAHPDLPALNTRAKGFLQNVGGFLSSRAAEDELVRRGLLPAAAAETLFSGDPAAEIRRHLQPAFPAIEPAQLQLATCGMNAIYAAFRAAAELQATRGRTIWIQLGWLYLDTIALLEKFTATPADYVYVRHVSDHDALTRLFTKFGSRIAGIIAEVPTNPLIQTPDLPALAQLARAHGALLLVDPSVTSVFNVEVLPHSALVVSSLTKYTAPDGDLTAGLVVVNPAHPDAATLQTRIAALLEPPYPRDLARLAAQIPRTPALLAALHANVPRVVEFLSRHPGVRDVFWTHQLSSRRAYQQIARAPDAVGGVLSFTLRGPLEKFYDRLRLPKGSSFGMATTLICPFMYLAHYDLVTTPAGIAALAASGLDPDLLRLSVGTEPAEDIIAALAEALD
ncbi:PLP-dependent transferase [Horticoccus luteus]|uniref:PLP-dependent transferase n=1 Tax=Horticoccus luteus TaxID=2862869 RepID=A0A8F9XJH2_9BACT|nr:PLP-dependent transferase [Horticoccus luteus]QYM78668.1 PLP-dependent transferase [Horticoccus luteus]